MNALKIAQNEDFQLMATVEAFKMISADTGISVKSLVEQFKAGNEALIKAVSESVAIAAKALEESINN